MSLSISTKNSLLLIFEKIIILGFSFLNSVLLARLAGPEIFGQYSYIISFSGLFAPLCIMGLNNIATKYFVKYPQNSHHYLLSALTVRVIGAILSILIGLVVAFYFSIDKSLFPLLATLLILQCFTVFYIIEYYFLASNKVIFTLKIRLSVLITIGIAKLIVILYGANLVALITLHGFGFCLVGLGYLWVYYQAGYHKHQKRAVNIKSISSLFHKGKWLLLSGVAAILYLKIDQIMLAHFHGVTEVAYYAAATKLSEFWYVFPILIANAFNPKLIMLHKENKDQYNNFITKLLSFMMMSALFISLLTYFLSTFIIHFIYGEQYQQSAEILNIHILATIFIFQMAILSKWLIIGKHYKFSLYSHGLGAISNIILNLMLIPKFGGIGAAWATLLSYFIASFFSLTLFKSTRPFMLLMVVAMLKWPAILWYTTKNEYNTINNKKSTKEL